MNYNLIEKTASLNVSTKRPLTLGYERRFQLDFLLEKSIFAFVESREGQ